MPKKKNIQDNVIQDEYNKSFCTCSVQDRYEWAKKFIDKGYSIIPIKVEGKEPFTRGWQQYCTIQDNGELKQLSNDDIEHFLYDIQKKGDNYAIPCGQNHLIVLDFEDIQVVQDWTGKDWLNEICSNTLCVSTPHGGIHVYITSKDLPQHKFNPVFQKEGKGIADLQTYGSYVVAPHSCLNHKNCKSGKCPYKGQEIKHCYTPLNDNEIGEFDIKELLKTLEEKGKDKGITLSNSAHEWLYGNGNGKVIKKTLVRSQEAEAVRQALENFKKLDSGRSIEEIKEEVKDTETDPVVIDVVVNGKTYAECEIKDDTSGKGDWRIIRSLMRIGVTDPDKILQLLPEDSKAKTDTKWDKGKYLANTLKNAWKTLQEEKAVQQNGNGSKIGKDKDNDKQEALTIEKVTNEILNDNKIYTFTGRGMRDSWTDGTYVVDEKGLYVYHKETELDAIIDRYLSKYKKFKINEDERRAIRNIREKIIRKTLTPLPSDNLTIIWENGALDSSNLKFTWHDFSEGLRSFNYIPWSLDFDKIKDLLDKPIEPEDIEQKAKELCPNTLNAFKQWVGDDWLLAFEAIGYTAVPSYIFNKAIIIVGSGSNGKSVFFQLLDKMLGGKNNVSEEPLSDFVNGNRHSTAQLYRKLANISAEASRVNMKNDQLFKALTGGDIIKGEVKFKDPFYFTNYAKLFISVNELPYVDDKDHAFWRRLLVLEFNNRIEEKEADPQYLKNTFTDQEIRGAWLVSILAFQRVMQRHAFDERGNGKEIKEEWKESVNSVYEFTKYVTENDLSDYDPNNPNLFIPVTEFMEAYQKWANEEKKHVELQPSVTRTLRNDFHIKKLQRRINGKPKWCYIGIRLKKVPNNERVTVDEGS